MAKKRFTLEDNYDEVLDKIKNNTQYAKNEIGRSLVREIRPKVKRMPTSKPGNKFMRATLQSWARRDEGDIIIGFKDPAKIGFLKGIDWLDEMEWKYDEVADPIKPTVVSNIDNIRSLIGESLAHKANRGRDKGIFGGEDTEP